MVIKFNINGIINEKRKLLLDEFSKQPLHENVKVGSFKENSGERVEIIRFSEDGTKVETFINKIEICDEIGRGVRKTCFNIKLDNDDGYVLKMSNSTNIIPILELVNEQLLLELTSIYAGIYNLLNPSKKIYISKPFILVFIERIPLIYSHCEIRIEDYDNLKNPINNDKIISLSHLSLFVSGNSQMITNISENGGIYTKVQVHSDDDNQGSYFIFNFLKSHKCNSICKVLGIEDSLEFSEEKELQVYSKFELNQTLYEMNRLGALYYFGNKINKAIELFEKCEILGDPNAPYNIAKIYQLGKGEIQIDLARAIEYYKRAIKLKQVDAMYDLGTMYMQGNINLTKAVKYLERSSKLGNSLAPNTLGVLYQNGKGEIEQDIKKALTYYQKAAILGNQKALYNIGLLYHFGKYEPIIKDTNKAKEYYQKASNLGHVKAKKKLDELSSKLYF